MWSKKGLDMRDIFPSMPHRQLRIRSDFQLKKKKKQLFLKLNFRLFMPATANGFYYLKIKQPIVEV